MMELEYSVVVAVLSMCLSMYAIGRNAGYRQGKVDAERAARRVA